MELYKGKMKGSNYFMGAMVFTPHRSTKKIQILDGQQRFATFLLFLASLRDVVKETKFPTKDARVAGINEMIYKSDVVKVEKNPKLELNREDKEFFDDVVINGKITQIKYDSHKRIRDAYNFFMEVINIKVTKDGDKFVEHILDILLNKIILIKIEVDSDENAHIIFETLNDRGLDLSVADLVKNYICSIASDRHVDSVIRLWIEMIDHVGDRNATKFIRHYWNSIYKLARKDELYKRLKEKVNSRNVTSFMKRKANEAAVYSYLHNPSQEFWGDRKIVSALDELNALNVEQVYSLLMALYEKLYLKKPAEFRKSLMAIVNFTFRYSTICGLNPNELERDYNDLSVKLRAGKINEREVIKTVKEKSPSRKLFLNMYEDKEITNRKLARYILLKINNHLLKKSGAKELTTDVDAINLEHIIPKSPNREWKKYFRDENIDEKNLINRIGNLTVLGDEFNKIISNKYYDKKKEMYKKSKLPLNQELLGFSEFGEFEVKNRQRNLGVLAEKLWKI